MITTHTRLHATVLCQPQLCKHGLYNRSGADTALHNNDKAIMWTFGYADGTALGEIARLAGVNLVEILTATERLLAAGLVEIA